MSTSTLRELVEAIKTQGKTLADAQEPVPQQHGT